MDKLNERQAEQQRLQKFYFEEMKRLGFENDYAEKIRRYLSDTTEILRSQGEAFLNLSVLVDELRNINSKSDPNQIRTDMQGIFIDYNYPFYVPFPLEESTFS